jgi:hypothetical protein
MTGPSSYTICLAGKNQIPVKAFEAKWEAYSEAWHTVGLVTDLILSTWVYGRLKLHDATRPHDRICNWHSDQLSNPTSYAGSIFWNRDCARGTTSCP